MKKLLFLTALFLTVHLSVTAKITGDERTKVMKGKLHSVSLSSVGSSIQGPQKQPICEKMGCFVGLPELGKLFVQIMIEGFVPNSAAENDDSAENEPESTMPDLIAENSYFDPISGVEMPHFK